MNLRKRFAPDQNPAFSRGRATSITTAATITAPVATSSSITATSSTVAAAGVDRIARTVQRGVAAAEPAMAQAAVPTVITAAVA